MKDLVIFGAGQIAELADFYFGHDGGRRVSAFCVDDDYVEGTSSFGRPLIAASELAERHPPEEADMFVAVSYSGMNRLRAERCERFLGLGYELASYISPRASIYPNVSVGWNAFLFEDNTIQPFVRIGNGVTMWSGNHVGHHSTVEDYAFLTSHVVVAGGVTVGRGSFLGVNATLRDHITIGEHTLVGAGAIILRSTEPESVYIAKSTPPSGKSSLALRGI